jgi:acetyltransferase-like isoleucine patch superfamily enzyme
VQLGRGVRIDADHVEIGDDVYIADGVAITAGRVTIGPMTRIRDGVSITDVSELAIEEYVDVKAGVEVSGYGPEPQALSLGQNAWVGERTFFNVHREVRVGDNVGIGRESQLWTHGYFLPEVDGYPVRWGETTLESDSWLLPRVIVMPGVRIARGAVVATGSAVSRDLEAPGFYGGNPAKLLREDEAFRTPMSPENVLATVQERLVELLQSSGAATSVDGDVLEVRGGGETVYFLSSRDEARVGQIEADPAATWFDLGSRTYRRRGLALERLVKSGLNDRTVRFVRAD